MENILAELLVHNTFFTEHTMFFGIYYIYYFLDSLESL